MSGAMIAMCDLERNAEGDKKGRHHLDAALTKLEASNFHSVPLGSRRVVTMARRIDIVGNRHDRFHLVVPVADLAGHARPVRRVD